MGMAGIGRQSPTGGLNIRASQHQHAHATSRQASGESHMTNDGLLSRQGSQGTSGYRLVGDGDMVRPGYVDRLVGDGDMVTNTDPGIDLLRMLQGGHSTSSNEDVGSVGGEERQRQLS